MSITVALNNAISGIQAAQVALATTSQNISNANTPGYSRQTAGQAPRIIEGVGSGVAITDITRSVDQFLLRELRAQNSDSGATRVADEFYRQMQNMFGAPGQNSSIAADLSAFDSALEALANTPENASLRFDVVASGQSLARTTSKLATDIQALRKEADRQIKEAVGVLNTEIDEARKLNIQISRARAADQSVPDLEDQLDRAVKKISEQIDVNVIDRGNGSIEMFTTAGLALLDGLGRRIDYDPATTVTDTTVFGALTTTRLDLNGDPVGKPQEIASSGTSANVTTSLVSGRIKGLLDMRDSALPDLAAQLEALSDTLRDQVNAIHNQGSGFPPPNALTGTRTVTTADSFQATGTMRVAVLDSTGLVVDSVDVDLTGLGATTVGGLISQISAGLGANAVVQVNNGNLSIQAASAGNGIAINDIGSAESTTGNGVAHFFGLNDFFVGDRAVDLAVRADIVSNPSRVSSAELSTTATTGQPGITVGDNRAALKLAGIDDTAFSFAAVGGLPASQVSLNEFTGAMIGLNSVRAADAAKVSARNELLFENLDNLATSQTGVNLDEELSNLILFQNAFEMSARVMTIASDMFKTLIDALG